ncbi:carbohydrate ABC transporter permease [Paenibacillus thermoaerophilus]|uniref:Carbohydrate ABC transporter permease n=1 Tax=Paenibacillus thermoaerophilus TaxID=1215385 RepID=A0ABW2V2Z8_9BACL|nr:carbohydrate ABC transporter permease [Paenibacillus thermoaerophilus]TMV18660.1 carbohydrate ABC transporter permease [Paenibacillus thermoaerophilus]
MRAHSVSRKLFQVFNAFLFLLFSISIVVPFVNAIAISLSSYDALATGSVNLWPKGFSLEAYKELAYSKQFLRTFLNTVGLTVVNTVLTITVSLAAGYSMAHKHLLGRSALFIYLIIPMYFSGGLIPTYLLVNKLGLTNTYAALVLPQIVSTFYIIVFRNQINQLPKELLESAEIDGAGETRILFNIILPLVLPMTMAFVVFSAVAYWNEWFNALIYIRDREMWTLQLQLRDILINTSQFIDQQTQNALIGGAPIVHPENMKMAALMLTVLPIIAVYPFVQKYFIHGQLVGAVKG